MNRRQFLSTPAALARKPRPNVLLILPDQLRAQALGCFGDPNVQTPNIDRLAGEGLRLPNTIANSPVCCPARANILTGRYAHSNGMIANDLRLRESQPTLSSVLGANGYRTGFIGKWHLDGGPRMPGFVPPGPRRHGFEYWAANECSHAHFDTQYFRDTPEPIAMKKFEAEGWTDLTLDFLRGTADDGRPFFLTVQMGPPHDPYRAPREYSRLYDPGTLKLRNNWRKGVTPVESIAEYYAMITAVDDQVGRILAELDWLKLTRDTIVLFSSDHGDMLGSQGERLKRKPWEESIRVPGIIRYPRAVRAGRKSEAVFSHVDFAPTLLALCGVRAPATMQGSNLAPVITGAVEQGPTEAFLQIFGPFKGDGTPAGWRGVRTQRYTYARWENEPWVLYDNLRDPDQQRNLAGDPTLAARLDRRVESWMRRTGDSWSHNWTFPVEDNGRLYSGRAYYTVGEYLESQTVEPLARTLDLSGGGSSTAKREAVILYATAGLPSHAFVALEREDDRGRRTVVEAWGYYPDPAAGTARAATRRVRGHMLDDLRATSALPRAEQALVVYVNARQFRAVRDVIERWRCNGSYRLLETDCVTFVEEAARTLRLQTPPRGLLTSRPADYVRRLIELN